jgi:hypothetical protein
MHSINDTVINSYSFFYGFDVLGFFNESAQYSTMLVVFTIILYVQLYVSVLLLSKE